MKKMGAGNALPPEVIEAACERHKPDLMNHPQLEDVLSVDSWAREAVREQVSRGTRRVPRI